MKTAFSILVAAGVLAGMANEAHAAKCKAEVTVINERNEPIRINRTKIRFDGGGGDNGRNLRNIAANSERKITWRFPAVSHYEEFELQVVYAIPKRGKNGKIKYRRSGKPKWAVYDNKQSDYFEAKCGSHVIRIKADDNGVSR